MTRKGLTDGQRTGMGILIYSLIAIGAYVATTPDLKMLVIPFAIASIIAGIAKDQLGIREATTSDVSRATEPGLRTSKSLKRD